MDHLYLTEEYLSFGDHLYLTEEYLSLVEITYT